jgi:hypothetical protein
MSTPMAHHRLRITASEFHGRKVVVPIAIRNYSCNAHFSRVGDAAIAGIAQLNTHAPTHHMRRMSMSASLRPRSGLNF